jgi:hypothetical protein
MTWAVFFAPGCARPYFLHGRRLQSVSAGSRWPREAMVSALFQHFLGDLVAVAGWPDHSICGTPLWRAGPRRMAHATSARGARCRPRNRNIRSPLEGAALRLS